MFIHHAGDTDATNYDTIWQGGIVIMMMMSMNDARPHRGREIVEHLEAELTSIADAARRRLMGHRMSALRSHSAS